MKPLNLGDFTIGRAVEMEGPFREPTFIIPEADPELIEANRDWLMPRFIDPESGFLIMSFHSFVIRTGKHTILVDACVGNDKERPERPMWHRRNGDYLERLAAQGVQPEDVDYVMCTHLHADHVGWNTRLVDGRWVPTFPNAKYIFGRIEYEYWHSQQVAAGDTPINHGCFNDSVLPVVEAGQSQLVDDGHELSHGIWVENAPGHTPGNAMLHLRSNGAHAVVCGDTIHHPVQLLRPGWSSAFCEDPVQSAVSRTRLVETYADTDSRILTAHFPDPVAGRIVSDSGGNGFRFRFDR